MKYNKKFAGYAMVPVLGIVGLLGANAASAQGLGMGMMGGPFSSLTAEEMVSRQQLMFEQHAKILGLTVAEIKAAWAEGKGMPELMQAKGITKEQVQARMREQQLAQLKTQLQALVSKGVITQAQADARLTFISSQQNQSKKARLGGKPRGHMGGFGGFGTHL